MECDRCNRVLSPGENRYVMTLRLTADFDGHLPSEGDSGLSLEALVAQCEALSEQELDAQVDEVRAYTLCGPCRQHIGGNPLQRAIGADHGGGQLQ